MAQPKQQSLIINKAQHELQSNQKKIKAFFDKGKKLVKTSDILNLYCDDKHDEELIHTIKQNGYDEKTLWLFAHPKDMTVQQIKGGQYNNEYHSTITSRPSVQSFVYIICESSKKFEKNSEEASEQIQKDLENNGRSLVAFESPVFTLKEGILVCPDLGRRYIRDPANRDQPPRDANFWNAIMPEYGDEKEFESYEKNIKCVATSNVQRCKIAPIHYLNYLSKKPGYHSIGPDDHYINRGPCRAKYKPDEPPQVDAKACWQAIEKVLDDQSFVYFDGDTSAHHHHPGHGIKKHHGEHANYDYNGHNDVLIDIEYGILLVNIIGILCCCCFIAICIGILGGIGISEMVRSVKRNHRRTKYSSFEMDEDDIV